MPTAYRGDPIYHNDRMVARFATNVQEDGMYIRWAWFCPKTSEELQRGPQYVVPRFGEKRLLNEGLLSLDYERGDTRIWVAWDMMGDVSTAFDNRRMFLPPDTDMNMTPTGIAKAARIVKKTAPPTMPEFIHYLDYLISKGEHYAEGAF